MDMERPTYERVKHLREKGLSCIEIAKIYGVKRQRIYQVLDKQYNNKRKALYTGRPKVA